MIQSFSREVKLSAEVERTWGVVSTFTEVLSWFSIVGSATEIEPARRYSAVLTDRVGPFRLHADLNIDLAIDESRHAIHAQGRGEDRQMGSRIALEVDLRLAPLEGGTALEVLGTYEITGRPATLGAATIVKKADRALEEFVSAAHARLAA
jgi:carbon monoxide dehydrogenase subunit G